MNPIEVHDGVILRPMAEAVLRHLEGLGWNYGWKSTGKREFAHWHVDLCSSGVSRFNRSDVTAELDHVIRPVWEVLAATVMREHPVPVRAYANLHTYGIEGYPHTDSEEDLDRTAVLYLTPEWHRDWGGETAFYEGPEIICAVMPKMARLVTFRSSIFHAARGVTRICPKMRPVLVFKARPADVES